MNHNIIISRFYTRANSKTGYPIMVIDADRARVGSDDVKTSVLMCDDDGHDWMPHDDAPEWTISEVKDLTKLAKEKIELMGEYA